MPESAIEDRTDALLREFARPMSHRQRAAITDLLRAAHPGFRASLERTALLVDDDPSSSAAELVLLRASIEDVIERSLRVTRRRS